ncbi:hypothetical protein HPP92_018914 [Vanilla planifolia]|uniref:Uncharacterized protein n=1 Tax=Vanilla planifolia TaxID=51239 RepID=A0A835UL85_VANPL|nr:hypothetical protein HPP92_018914 [Vanilla planifolia]
MVGFLLVRRLGVLDREDDHRDDGEPRDDQPKHYFISSSAAAAAAAAVGLEACLCHPSCSLACPKLCFFSGGEELYLSLPWLLTLGSLDNYSVILV